MVIKVVYQPEALRPWSYPPRAVEEAIANCIFHRNYQQHDPVRVFLHADRLVFQNGGGPDRAIRAEDFDTGRVQPRHYRNRRLGSFLKALDLTEGFATGIRLMLNELAANGSAPPVFSMDDERTYFAVEFALHPAFIEQPKPSKPPTRFVIKSTALSKIDFSAFEAAYLDWPDRELTDEERETHRVIIRNLPLLSIQLLLNLSERTVLSRRQLLDSIDVTNQTKNAERFLDPLRWSGLSAH